MENNFAFNDPKTKYFSPLLTEILAKKGKMKSFFKFGIALEIMDIFQLFLTHFKMNFT